MDHLRELQGRLFSTVFIFLIVASAAYPFFDKITEFLIAPLKNGQELVYLTPGGAFGFIIKVCAYVGLIGVLPVIIYHVYRFVMPAVRYTKLRTVIFYTLASMALAVCGVMFAYYISLPAALQFLTGFNLNHINPMLTIDSYFSFVMTYMLAGALLFQLPLVMLITNSVTPLTPKKLMSKQRHMIVGSFVVAAIISPTPDALNQTILASPVVVMYQLGILMIWMVNFRAKRRAHRAVHKDMSIESKAESTFLHTPDVKYTPPITSLAALNTPIRLGQVSLAAAKPLRQARSSTNTSMDMVHHPRTRPGSVKVPKRGDVTSPMGTLRTGVAVSATFGSAPRRSIDGVIRPQRATQ